MNATETQGRGTRVRVGLGLLAILNKEVKEGLTEKGIPEEKNSRGGRELHETLRKE